MKLINIKEKFLSRVYCTFGEVFESVEKYVNLYVYAIFERKTVIL